MVYTSLADCRLECQNESMPLCPIIGGDKLRHKRLLHILRLLFFLSLVAIISLSSCVGVLPLSEGAYDDMLVSTLNTEPIFSQPPLMHTSPPIVSSEPETVAEYIVEPEVEPDDESGFSESINGLLVPEESEDETDLEPTSYPEYTSGSYGLAAQPESDVEPPEELPPTREHMNTIYMDCGDPSCDSCDLHMEVNIAAPTSDLEEALGRRPRLALTFDDGPGPYTMGIIEILEENNGRATFCVLGNRVSRWPHVIRRMHGGGHEIVGHSWNHANLTLQSRERIERQILDTSAAIEAITGVATPPIFRAPYGAVNARVRSTALDAGYSLLGWSIDTNDWRYRDVDHIYNHIMERAVDGAIILLHDIHETTYQAMQLVIPSLVEMGFDLVTAGEIIEQVYGSMVPGQEFRGRR